MILKKSRVVFDEIAHTYFLDGMELSGITPILHRQLFPDKYGDIAPEVLGRAAEYGKGIHELIEICDTIDPDNQDDVYRSYRGLLSSVGLDRLDNEYLVSDNVRFASSIDLVCSDFSLCDFKCTAKFDADYLSWQLSIYAYLFELQNGFPSGRLFGIWLPKPRYGKPKIVELPKIKAVEIAKLLDCEARGEQYLPPLKEYLYINN